jgi:glycosyltransferase involved in cell wall biosynthesis
MRLKVAVVSRSDRTGGGASKVACDLVDLLNSHGHYAHHYRRDLCNGYTNLSTSVYGRWEVLAKKTYYKLKILGFQELVPFEYFHLISELKKHQYDVVHFHDLTTAVSPYTLMMLSKIVPIVWTLHDCSFFTGGCLYPMECEEYLNGCKKCPEHGKWPFEGYFDLAHLHYLIKKKLHKKNLHLIAPSKWLAEYAKNSKIIYRDIKVISNGVDTSVYECHDKQMMKKKL